MSEFIKVSMGLSAQDIENAESVRQLFHVKTGADAVSAALGLTRSLGEIIQSGKELLIRNKKGEIRKLFIEGIPDEL